MQGLLFSLLYLLSIKVAIVAALAFCGIFIALEIENATERSVC
ncbi:MAG: hypothetical protein QOJ02_2095 [Acidobacteriota bacterium]|jgi:hypothetical protein|nr:hypothetical protein [Acidobacteriota bacterium]